MSWASHSPCNKIHFTQQYNTIWLTSIQHDTCCCGHASLWEKGAGLARDAKIKADWSKDRISTEAATQERVTESTFLHGVESACISLQVVAFLWKCQAFTLVFFSFLFFCVLNYLQLGFFFFFKKLCSCFFVFPGLESGNVSEIYDSWCQFFKPWLAQNTELLFSLSVCVCD